MSIIIMILIAAALTGSILYAIMTVSCPTDWEAVDEQLKQDKVAQEYNQEVPRVTTPPPPPFPREKETPSVVTSAVDIRNHSEDYTLDTECGPVAQEGGARAGRVMGVSAHEMRELEAAWSKASIGKNRRNCVISDAAADKTGVHPIFPANSRLPTVIDPEPPSVKWDDHSEMWVNAEVLGPEDPSVSSSWFDPRDFEVEAELQLETCPLAEMVPVIPVHPDRVLTLGNKS